MKYNYIVTHEYDHIEIIETNLPSFRLARLRAKLGERQGAEVSIELEGTGLVYNTEDGVM
jgi:hypothetical protein